MRKGCLLCIFMFQKSGETQNLSTNQNRLTTPFDIHSTLKHIINGMNSSQSWILIDSVLTGKPDLSLKYGKSLLEEIPEERSCKSIPISEHWCGCQTSIPIENLNLNRTDV